MTTTIDIANRALLAIGLRKKITSLTQDSLEAQTVALVVNDIRDGLLRLAPWNFALGPGNLTLLSAAPGTQENPTAATTQWVPGQPIPPWLYSYAYPADCLRACWMTNTNTGSYQGIPISPVTDMAGLSSGRPIPFTTMYDASAPGGPQQVILTNLKSATLFYIHQVNNPDTTDTMFQSAWTATLAANLAMVLSQDKQLANMMLQQANSSISSARVPDGNEGPLVIDSTPDWISARGYSTPSDRYNAFDWGPLWPMYL